MFKPTRSLLLYLVCYKVELNICLSLLPILLLICVLFCFYCSDFKNDCLIAWWKYEMVNSSASALTSVICLDVLEFLVYDMCVSLICHSYLVTMICLRTRRGLERLYSL